MHLKTRTGEKPYQWIYTSHDSGFIQENTLKLHLKIHTGEKKHINSYIVTSFIKVKEL